MLSNLSFESDLWKNGYSAIVGVDEVGRGCIAGPIVAGAVVWSPDILEWERVGELEKFSTLSQITDSKKLSAKKRETLSAFILEHCLGYAFAEVSAEEIDEKGISYANKKAMHDAVEQVREKSGVDAILSDHFPVKIGAITSMAITKGDALSLTIASASIIAKVYRDTLMHGTYHTQFSQYGFNKHVGYGTKQHMDAIKEFGPCKLHRKTFLHESQ